MDGPELIMARLIEFAPTPNPDAMRVLPSGWRNGGPSGQFVRGAPSAPPLATALLAIDGIARIFIGRDFISVVRDGTGHDWGRLRTEVALVLADLLEGHDADPAAMTADPALTPFDDVEQQIEAVLERWVRPLLASDGGDAVLDRFEAGSGTAWVRMEGACGGCPSGTLTLKRSIEQAIRKWVPEVTRVEAVSDAGESLADPKTRFRAWVVAKFGKA